MSEKGRLSILQLVAMVMFTISTVFSSNIMSDRQIFNREIFILRLEVRMDSQTR